MNSLQKLLINAVITATAYRYKRWHVSKGKKKGMLHLLVASFRALPLDLMVPVSRRGFVWIFSWIFFSSFLFFLCPFSLGFSIQTRYLSSIVSLDTFAHAHSPKSAGSKCQKKFGTIYHFDVNLIWSGCVDRGHLLSCQSFRRWLRGEKQCTLQKKKCPTLL